MWRLIFGFFVFVLDNDVIDFVGNNEVLLNEGIIFLVVIVIHIYITYMIHFTIWVIWHYNFSVLEILKKMPFSGQIWFSTTKGYDKSFA